MGVWAVEQRSWWSSGLDGRWKADGRRRGYGQAERCGGLSRRAGRAGGASARLPSGAPPPADGDRWAEWSYLRGGQGEETLLLLPGGERIGDLGFTLVEAFEPQRRVLYLSYPPLPTMRALVDGLAQLLDAQGIAQVTLVGPSFGGDVAQVFVRVYPERVKQLVLANTGVPDPRIGRLTSGMMRAVALAPIEMLRAMIQPVLARALTSQESERVYWRAALAELCRSLTKADILASFADTVDCRVNYAFSPEDLRDWPGRILILESDDDPGARPTMRAALRALYPQAQVHTFHGAGHTPFLSQPDEYLAVVGGFLDRGELAASS